MPARRCTVHAVIFRYSVGLPGTDDPHIGEKVAVFKFFKIRFRPKGKKLLVDRTLKIRISIPLGGYFSVSLPLNFSLF